MANTVPPKTAREQELEQPDNWQAKVPIIGSLSAGLGAVSGSLAARGGIVKPENMHFIKRDGSLSNPQTVPKPLYDATGNPIASAPDPFASTVGGAAKSAYDWATKSHYFPAANQGPTTAAVPGTSPYVLQGGASGGTDFTKPVPKIEQVARDAARNAVSNKLNQQPGQPVPAGNQVMAPEQPLPNLTEPQPQGVVPYKPGMEPAPGAAQPAAQPATNTWEKLDSTQLNQLINAPGMNPVTGLPDKGIMNEQTKTMLKDMGLEGDAAWTAIRLAQNGGDLRSMATRDASGKLSLDAPGIKRELRKVDPTYVDEEVNAYKDTKEYKQGLADVAHDADKLAKTRRFTGDPYAKVQAFIKDQSDTALTSYMNQRKTEDAEYLKKLEEEGKATEWERQLKKAELDFAREKDKIAIQQQNAKELAEFQNQLPPSNTEKFKQGKETERNNADIAARHQDVQTQANATVAASENRPTGGSQRKPMDMEAFTTHQELMSQYTNAAPGSAERGEAASALRDFYSIYGKREEWGDWRKPAAVPSKK